jgi:hypothetical protein
MGDFDDIHAGAISGSLTMFDRLIFKGYITRCSVGTLSGRRDRAST